MDNMPVDTKYHWVKWNGKWHIASCDIINDWHISGMLTIFNSSDFEEIDETPIIRINNETSTDI